VNDPPVITGQAALETAEDTPLTITPADLTVSDPDDSYPADFTFALQPGEGYSVVDAVVTPDAEFAGTLTIPVTVNDGDEESAPFDLLVSVTAANDPPVISGQVVLETAEDNALTITLDDLTVVDPDDAYPQDFTLTVRPGEGYTVVDAVVTPSSDFSGPLPVGVTVNDGDTDSAEFALLVTVTPVNDPPVITGQAVLTTLEAMPLTIALADLVVADPDNAYPADFTLTLLEGAQYLLTAPNEITPVEGFTGELLVPAIVNDGTDDSAAFELHVSVTAPEPVPPEIVGQGELTTMEDMPLTITLADLTVTDPDSVYPDDFTLTLQAGTNYTLAGAEISPARDFFGSLTVPVVVNDGTSNSEPFGLLITVTAVNDRPEIVGQAPISTPEGTPVTVSLDDLLVTDPDNAYPLDFSLTLFDGSGYILSGSNEVTPDAGFSGQLHVPVVVHDGTEDSTPFDLVIEVIDAPNVAPVITGQAQLSTPEDTPLEITLADLAVSDPDNVFPDEFTFVLGAGLHYTVTGPGQVTPEAEFSGTLTIPIVVNDGTDDSTPFDLLVTVTPLNDIPVITGQSLLSTSEDVPLTITLAHILATDVDNAFPVGFSLTLEAGEHHTVTSADQITPAMGFTGPLTVPVTVNDGTDDSAPFDLLVTVYHDIVVSDPAVPLPDPEFDQANQRGLAGPVRQSLGGGRRPRDGRARARERPRHAGRHTALAHSRGWERAGVGLWRRWDLHRLHAQRQRQPQSGRRSRRSGWDFSSFHTRERQEPLHARRVHTPRQRRQRSDRLQRSDSDRQDPGLS
jgi:hypothetical protein